MTDTEKLDAAIKTYYNEHTLTDYCAPCEQLGRAMFYSTEYRKLESDWAALLPMAVLEDGPEMCVRMVFKMGMAVGMEYGKGEK